MERAPWLALHAFGYVFIPILAGIVLFAAGVKRSTGHFGEDGPSATAWLIAAGVGTYLLGLGWWRRLLRIGPVARQWVTPSQPRWGFMRNVKLWCSLGSKSFIMNHVPSSCWSVRACQTCSGA